MKKIRLIRVHTRYSYGHEEEITQFLPESDILEVTDEEYNLLTDYRVRDKIMEQRYGSYYDKLILVEDQTYKVPDLIKSAKEILEKVAKKEAAAKKKAAETAAAKKIKAEKLKIEKARKILKEAGELK